MAVTIDNKVRISLGNRTMVIADIDFDSSYPSGGESFALSDFGLTRRVDFGFGYGSGYTVVPDRTNLTLQVYYTDLSASSDGPEVEVADMGNLSTLTNVRMVIIGV